MSARPGLVHGDPTQIGPYRILGRLGVGRMGVVFAATDSQDQPVAVKVIRKEIADDPSFRARLVREVAAVSRVQGPFLLPLLAADTASAQPWLATPYAPGPTLVKHVSTSGPLHSANLYGLAAGVAGALQVAHAVNIIHRDLKPANVILTLSGPCVLDFGIAHALDESAITPTGQWTGTPGWTAPEQYKGASANPASDVFAWGALVTYAATGRLPFGTGTPDVVAWRIIEGEPDLVGLPDDLWPHVTAALAKDPNDRPHAADLAALLAPLLAAQPAVAGYPPTVIGTPLESAVAAHWTAPRPDTPSWHTPPPSPGHGVRTALISAMAAVVVIAAGTAGYTVIHQSTSASGRTPPRTATAPNAPGTGAGTSVSPSSDPGTSASTRKSSWVTEPAMTIDTTATYTATIKLDQGTIGLSLDAGNAPHTVNSFTFLAGQGFFDGTKCHRLTTQGIFVLQCGDPKGDGTGGPGYTIPDENLTALGKAGNDGTVTYPAGTVAMANTGQPHTGGSQFFLVYKDSKLPPSYTPFGTMDDASLKAVGNIGAAGVAGGATDGAPNIAVVIDGAAVVKS